MGTTVQIVKFVKGRLVFKYKKPAKTTYGSLQHDKMVFYKFYCCFGTFLLQSKHQTCTEFYRPN